MSIWPKMKGSQYEGPCTRPPSCNRMPRPHLLQANAFLQESPRGSSSEAAPRVNFRVSKFLVIDRGELEKRNHVVTGAHACTEPAAARPFD